MSITISFQEPEVFLQHGDKVPFSESSHADTLNRKHDIQQRDLKQRENKKVMIDLTYVGVNFLYIPVMEADHQKERIE